MLKWIKILLAVLLLGCLTDAPYGYYQLVRFLAMSGFGWLAFESYTGNNRSESVLFLLLSLLFQPFVKISLGRDLWNLVDVVVALGLVVSVLRSSVRGGAPKN